MKIVRSYRRLDRSITAAVARERRLRAQAIDSGVVLAAVERRTGVNLAQMQGRDRSRDVTYARHLAMYELTAQSLWTSAELVRMFHRDHSTVLAGIRRIEKELTTRSETARDVAAIDIAIRRSA